MLKKLSNGTLLSIANPLVDVVMADNLIDADDGRLYPEVRSSLGLTFKFGKFDVVLNPKMKSPTACLPTMR